MIHSFTSLWYKPAWVFLSSIAIGLVAGDNHSCRQFAWELPTLGC